MTFSRHFEGLTDLVTRRWQRGYAEPVGTDTEQLPTPDEYEDPADSLFPASSTVAAYEKRVNLIESRAAKYRIYNEMDAESPEYSSALDIFADNATRGDQNGNQALTIKSDNPRVAQEIERVRKDLGLDEILWTLARDIAKFGERAEEVIVNSQYRITRLKPLPTLRIIPQKDAYGRDMDPAYIQVDPEKPDEVQAEFKDWQVLYFANKKSRADLHGEGLGFPIRRAFLQLRMMEDAVVIARLTRAHNRLAYLVDVGEMPPKKAQQHLTKVKSALRKRRSVGPDGKMQLDWSPLSIEEDIFIATNKDSKADVKVLQGDLTLGNLADLEYFQQKKFTGLKVPKAYLQHEKDTRSRAVITEADIQFARSVRRLQHVIERELRKLFDLALLLRGIDPRTALYEIHLPVISIIDELRVWQTRQLQALVAQMWKQTFWPSDEWILKELLGYPDDQVARLLKDQKKPDQYNGLYQQPKIGNAPKNMATKEAVAARLAELNPEEFEAFEEATQNLHMLLQWQGPRGS